jgi:hypothetical protein
VRLNVGCAEHLELFALDRHGCDAFRSVAPGRATVKNGSMDGSSYDGLTSRTAVGQPVTKYTEADGSAVLGKHVAVHRKTADGRHA